MNAKISYDLFNKIRSQFSNIQIGDSTGQPTADPQEAVFFDFEFKEDADTFGRVSISLADGENMKVFYNRDLVSKIDEDSRDEWYAFLKELKDFAVEHQLAFDVRDITKSNLTKQDYKNLADTNATVNTDGMSEELNRITKLAGVEVKEGLTGTSKSSYENLDKTRLIIRHSGPVDETVPGSRSRHINSLYIENEDGERFKYPITHLAGARAMTRHVANGGRPHDEFGQHIIKTSENIAQLNSFSRYVSHKDQLNDNAGDIIEQTKLKLENLRAYIKNLGKQTHYDEASKNFKPSAIADLSDDERSAYREKFTMKHLDDRVENVLPLIHNIMQEYEPEPAGEPEPKTEPIVDHGAVVQGFLSDPAKKLVLRKDDSADRMLSVTKFTNNNTMLGSILSDIASRMLTRDDNEERVANFASRVADGLENEGELFNNGAFKPKKDRSGKAKEDAFEQWADSIVNPVPEKVEEKPFNGQTLTFEDIKPYVSMQKDSDGKTNYVVLDKDEKSIFQSLNPKDAMNFLSKNFNALRQGGMKPVMPAHWESKSLKESRTKIVEAIKSKADGHAQNIAGIEGDHDRITGEAGLQIARIKYLSNYQN